MLLKQIQHLQDFKKLSVDQLPELAEEIREFLINRLSITGGHLASNLGIVEVTLAIHHFYNSPTDKFIFDVGHQTYVHKILTGRKHLFHTLRKKNGLCGFIKRAESPHDVWEAGHSSTSLSAAMGMVLARNFEQKTHEIVAVIGDGALTGGMALEALNHIGHEQKRIVIILNDNEMSIAKNVGALHNYLGKLRSDRHYHKAKEEFVNLMKKIPGIGESLIKAAVKMKDGVKYLMVPGIWFEELGYTYFGPIDGHDINMLLNTLEQARQVKGPIIIHVVTMKGKGYLPAENDSHKWHGATPYKIESGQPLKTTSTVTYTDIFGQTLLELAQENKDIVAVTPAMPGGSGLLKFAAAFPDRMIDVGIAEQHAATMCAALALEGKKPVFAVYSTFLQRAYDQMMHDICRQKANVVIAIDRAGFVGPDGETHQGVFDISFLRHLPDIIIMMPKDENELRDMLYTSMAYQDGPIAIRYPRDRVIGVKPEDMKLIPIGTWEKIEEGRHLCIIATGPMLSLASQAKQELHKHGCESTIINARFIKPLDRNMLLSLASSEMPIIVLEEGTECGGLASAILEFYAKEKIFHIKVLPIGIPDRFIEHGTIEEQRIDAGLTYQHVTEEALKLLGRKLWPKTKNASMYYS